nr:hypothetical protein [Paphiopedilum micranthum]
MSGGAQRSSLNQTLNDFFLWMDLSLYSDIFSKKPKILYLARKQSTALGPGSEGNELGCFSSTLLFSECPFRMRFARRWRFALLLFLHWTVRMDFAVLSQRKWKGLYHITSRCRFVFRPK